MSEVSMYQVTPRQAKEMSLEVMEAGLTPYLHSSPGMGKSSIMRSIAKENSLKLIDHRLSTSAPEDLSGLPHFNAQGRAEFAPFADLFPIEGDDIPEDMNGWMIFLDEFPAASKQVQAAAFKLVLDRMTGQKNLHSNVVMAAAGNLMSDKSIVNPISTAMQSRIIHLELKLNFEEWLEDVAMPQKWDSRIIGFLSQYPSKLMDFKPNHTEKTFCCPRTWEFMNKLIQGKAVVPAKAPLYTGTISSGVAVEFMQFAQVYGSLVSITEILRDPEGAPLPFNNDTRWATVSMIMEHIKADNFDRLCTYANRFDMPFQVLFYRMAMINHPKLRTHPAFAKGMERLSQYLK
jgi:hypothetical protein